VLNTSAPVRSEKIKAQAVTLSVDFPKQPVSQGCPLRWVDLALEHGELNTLAVVLTGFRDTS
jgi:hypothetical protein